MSSRGPTTPSRPWSTVASARSESVWTVDPGRRGFLEMVAAVETVPDPVARFVALDAALSERMVADARAAGVTVIERAPGTSLDVTASLVVADLGIG
jgi:hypothetical protein